jgi:hypothetical protein
LRFEKEDKKMEFLIWNNIKFASLSTLAVIILTKIIYRHNPLYNEQYGKEIVLFNSNARYKREYEYLMRSIT